MPAAPDPNYDLQGAVEILTPGLVLQRTMLDAAAVQYAEQGFRPLNPEEVQTLLGPFPPFPTSLPRFADSNPTPDGWSIDEPSAVWV